MVPSGVGDNVVVAVAFAAFNTGTPNIPMSISGRNPRVRKAIDDDKRMRTSKECVNEMTARRETENGDYFAATGLSAAGGVETKI